MRPNVKGRPVPSTRAWTFVVSPPRLRPRASAAAVLLMPQLHVGGHARSCYLRKCIAQSTSPLASASCCKEAHTRCHTPRCASVNSDYRLFSTSQSVGADRARAHPSWHANSWHSAGCDGRGLCVLSWVFQVATAASVGPLRVSEFVSLCHPLILPEFADRPGRL